jgi:acetyl-CoA/propionyl-CoA/long-chain acyl-CoA carboxylase, biotin carboxylase, biotin carboxyl carrier protein
MIGRVLVANRAEIAVRVIRACHRLGIEAVVVHSEPDARSLAVELADNAVALGGSTAAETYLDVDKIVDAALDSACDALHPGYGFLAERAELANAAAAASLTWVGPSADVIATMGDKVAARRIARDAGVAPVPGALFAVDDPAAVRQFGDELGWPVAIKSVHGGGGRGMRVVGGPDEVAESLAAARREAQSSFGRPEVYVERFLARPRHVEAQIIADHHGGLVVVGDRDCSIQRRYQKLIEEAPAPDLPDAVRAALTEAAIRIALAVSYTSAGTVEFLVEDGELFFLEMNTRIQVEHPVTELVTGVDLVAEQLRIAGGQALSFGQKDVTPHGAAIEVRINAEDTTDGRFLPMPGTLGRFEPPVGPHVRVDTGYRSGDELPPEYDNLIAKIAVWGADREDARRRALDALEALQVDGVPTTAGIAAAVLTHPDFRTVAHTTSWLAEHSAELRTAIDEVEVLGRWYRIPRFDDSVGDSDAEGVAGTPSAADGPTRRGGGPATARRAGDGRVTAPMQGTVTTVDVNVGDAVTADTRVIALEAMKMENALLAGTDGVVTAVHVNVGANVSPGTLLVEVASLSRRDG